MDGGAGAAGIAWNSFSSSSALVGPFDAGPLSSQGTLHDLEHEAAVAAALASAASAASAMSAGRPMSGNVRVAAAAAASAASRLIHAEASGGNGQPSRQSSSNRRPWSAEEDATIRTNVQKLGPQWRMIAPLLKGRSDDSVRNRWKRLSESSGTDGGAPSAVHKRRVSEEHEPVKRHASILSMKEGAKECTEGCDGAARVSWSPREDQLIVRAVQELGSRWSAVAERLPGRTEQAVRNRWNRLQQRARVQARTMLNDLEHKEHADGGRP